jgi:hypothetical protein
MQQRTLFGFLKVVVVEVPVPHFSRLTLGNYQMQICFPEAVYNNL